ncbi:LysR family transcriptional regulator [Streptomyces noursei]|uniref:LysR family transcriptional regulator n=1 Tax=Streptomyces noursei TaxID=1971 RepID=UPI0038298B62
MPQYTAECNAEEGSISGAARRLHLTQPTLSRQLREMERQLGTVLFVREGRGPTPTPAGQVLVHRATAVLAEAEAALKDARPAAQGITGRLVATFAGSGINGPLGAALGRARRELPRVHLQSPRSYDEIIALCHGAGIVPWHSAEGRSVQTLLALVAAKFGAAVLADSHRALRRIGVPPGHWPAPRPRSTWPGAPTTPTHSSNASAPSSPMSPAPPPPRTAPTPLAPRAPLTPQAPLTSWAPLTPRAAPPSPTAAERRERHPQPPHDRAEFDGKAGDTPQVVSAKSLRAIGAPAGAPAVPRHRAVRAG